MELKETTIIEYSAKRLFPNLSRDEILARLLLERAQKNLIKYQSMSRQFENKYGQDFDTFRQEILQSGPSFAVEQDYFDWELAITGIADMEEEIERLESLNNLP